MISFSFIIPHKNTPELLNKAISSIPPRSDVEIIVVDDNSNTTIVDFQNFPGKEREDVLLVFTEEGRGAGYARNIGLQKATGKWVLFCDADDFYTDELSTFLEKYKYSDADLILWKAKSLDLDTGLSGFRGETLNEFVDEGLTSGIFENALLISCPWKGMYSRKLLIDNGIIFNESQWGNDVVFSTKVAVATKSIIGSELFVYCITSHSNFGLVSKPTLRSSLVRFYQEVESIQIARRIFKHNRNMHKWFFDTWFGVYKFSKIQGWRILPTAFLADYWYFIRECIKAL